MTTPSERREPAYDPFGEPMDGHAVCADGRARTGAGRYRETRLAALVFWALAAMFVGARIYLADPSAPHVPIVEAAPPVVQVSALR